MRHGIAGNKLNRNSSLRKATIRDIAKATLIRQRICTTKAKAKEARKLVDKLITLGKKGSLADKRRAFSILCDHKIVSELFKITSPRFKNRVGGYTRIIPYGVRRGDNAELVFLELTEKEKVIISKQKVKKSKKKQDAEGKPAVKTTEQKPKDDKKPESELSEAPKDLAKKKEDKPQESSKSHSKPKDQGKASKRFVGGLRQMFKRKSPQDK